MEPDIVRKYSSNIPLQPEIPESIVLKKIDFEHKL